MAILKQKVDSHVTFLGWYGTCGNCENFDLTDKTDTISTIYQFSEDGAGVRTFSSNAPTFLQSFTELVCGNSYWIILKPGTSQIDIENFVVGYFGGSDLGLITSSCNENNHEATPTPTPIINCSTDTYQCPDGSYVSRNPNDDCNFYPCPSAPTPTPATTSGRFQPKSKVELLRAIGAYENTYENALKNYGNISTWDVSKITDMKELFANRRLLQTYDLSNWDVSNVVTMAGMFFNTKSVSSFGNLDKWNVGRVKTMSGMFNHSHHLTNIGNIENWNVGSVVKMNTMFTGCKQLKFIGNINKWQTNSLKETAYMFYNSGIQNINVSDWDVSNVTVLAGMFARTSVETLDLKNWNVSNVINLSNMFENATKLTSLDLSNWNVSKVRELHFLFFNTPKLTNVGNLSNWCVRNITSLPRRFAYMSPWYNNSENRPVWGTCPNSSDSNTDEPDREETEDSSDIPPPPGFGGYADFPVNEDLPYGEI